MLQMESVNTLPHSDRASSFFSGSEGSENQFHDGEALTPKSKRNLLNILNSDLLKPFGKAAMNQNRNTSFNKQEKNSRAFGDKLSKNAFGDNLSENVFGDNLRTKMADDYVDWPIKHSPFTQYDDFKESFSFEQLALQSSPTPPRTPSSYGKLSYCYDSDDNDDAEAHEEESQDLLSTAMRYEQTFANDTYAASAFIGRELTSKLFQEDRRFGIVDKIWDDNVDELAFVPTNGEESTTTRSKMTSDSIERTIGGPTRLENNTCEEEKRLLPGVFIMVSEGDLLGNFGQIISCQDGRCEVQIFNERLCEGQTHTLPCESLKPVIPDSEMNLTVEFHSRASIYFCPKDYILKDGEVSWKGMKVWVVMNPALKEAIPEGCNLEKLNGDPISDAPFEEIQAKLDELEPPYCLTMKFPTAVQQIRVADLPPQIDSKRRI